MYSKGSKHKVILRSNEAFSKKNIPFSHQKNIDLLKKYCSSVEKTNFILIIYFRVEPEMQITFIQQI